MATNKSKTPGKSASGIRPNPFKPGARNLPPKPTSNVPVPQNGASRIDSRVDRLSRLMEGENETFTRIVSDTDPSELLGEIDAVVDAATKTMGNTITKTVSRASERTGKQYSFSSTAHLLTRPYRLAVIFVVTCTAD